MHIVEEHAAADKLRLKLPGRRGERGVIEAVKGKKITVRASDGSVITASPNEFTNFSLAARKAWKSMPNRRVGRPRGSVLSDRISVTLRIDRELWLEFKRAEAKGIISDRTNTVNAWIKYKLQSLQTMQKQAS